MSFSTVSHGSQNHGQCFDFTNSRDAKIPVKDVASLERGTQISCVCVQLGAAFDHHGVFIGTLNPDLESHAKLLRCYKHLTDKYCVIDMTKGPNEKCLVRLQSVQEFANGDTIYAHVYKVPVFPPNEIVNRALLKLVTGESRSYDTITYNCEHFATEIVRGVGSSEQSEALTESVAAAATASAVGGVIGAGTATAIGMSSVIVAETVAVPLWGSAFLGGLGFTTTQVAFTTTTCFEAGLVTASSVVCMAAAGAVFAAAVVGAATYAWKKHSEASQKQQQLRQAAQDKQSPARLEKLGFDKKAINIAFCGGTGRGKSTCINALLSTDAAAVSASGEGTHEICKFNLQMPDNNANPALVLWDLPGAGTANHPESSYWEEKSLACFHVLLVFLELGEILDFERNIIQRAISERQPPVAVVFGQADRKISQFQKRGMSLDAAVKKLREEADREINRQFRLHHGETPPQHFIIAQKPWRQGRCSQYPLDESRLVAFLLRKTIDEEVSQDQINAVLHAMAMPWIH